MTITTDTLRAEITRSVNAVGNWEIIMRNTAGVYNAAFDVNDVFQLDVDVVGNTLIVGRVDGPAVTLTGIDAEDIWDEYVTVKGVDSAQDLLFHNDFAQEYPNYNQTLDDVLDDVFNTQLVGLTNITYVPQAGTPTVGAFEFKEGASFLSQLQELHRRAGYIFYIEDAIPPAFPPFELHSMDAAAPEAVPAPSVYTSIAGSPLNNILGSVSYQTRDGDKHYNYIRLYGKSPMFDGYTEYNGADWDVPAVLGGSTAGVLDDIATTMVGTYSIVAYNDATTTSCIGMRLDAPIYNYTTWDMRNGEIGIWARYDNTAGAPGTPDAGSADTSEYVFCALTDSVGTEAYYYGESTLLYIDTWGYCTFPLGEENYAGVWGGQVDKWTLVGAAPELDWEHIVSIEFVLGLVGNASAPLPASPSHFYIDGIGLPFPILSIEEAPAQQILYRRRPYVDCWSHIRSQNALDSSAVQILSQSGTTLIDKLNFVTPGTVNLRYAGQSIDVNIPGLGINTEVFYISKLHHIIEPYADVSGGYNFDWVTEIEAVPTSGVAYDHSRLGTGPLYSPTQKIGRTGAGVR